MSRIEPIVEGLIRRWVIEQPDRPALRDPSIDATVSYSQLWERASWMASDLVGHGVGARDVVAVSLDRSIELIIALLGILRAGAAYLPLDAHAPEARNVAILAEAKVKLVIGSSPQAARVSPDFPWTTRVTVPTVIPPGCTPPQDPASAGDDPCYIAYTSGSTGAPKGVVIPHRAVVRLVSRPHHCVLAPGDRCANLSNPAFDATTFEIWGALAAGATVVVFPSVLEITIDEWADLLRRERIDAMFLTTALFHMVSREQPTAFSSLATLLVGGEQLEMNATLRVLDAGPPRRLVNVYGPTETTTFATYFDCTPSSLSGLSRVPVGFPLPDTALHVLDEQMRQLPPGETGELCIGGPGVGLGYLGRPDLTAQRFVTEPIGGTCVYRTGDLARQLPSGAIDLLGRRDRQVKLRGFRIELEEVEQATRATGLCDAVVVEKIGEGLTAFLVGFVLRPAEAEADDLPAALAAALARQLPDYMIPARWVVLDEMPVGPTGKVNRARLLGQVPLLPEKSDADADAPISSLGAALGRIWQAVLKVPRADPGDNFVDLGGNSVMAVQVATRIKQQLGVAVEPADVLLADSLSDLARRLGAAGAVIG